MDNGNVLLLLLLLSTLCLSFFADCEWDGLVRSCSQSARYPGHDDGDTQIQWHVVRSEEPPEATHLIEIRESLNTNRAECLSGWPEVEQQEVEEE